MYDKKHKKLLLVIHLDEVWSQTNANSNRSVYTCIRVAYLEVVNASCVGIYFGRSIYFIRTSVKFTLLVRNQT